MAGVTIKTTKKPLTLKPTMSSAEAAGEQPEGVVQFTPPVVQQAGPSYVLEGVCAILTFVCFAALLLLQWVEWKDYMRPTAAFLPPAIPLGVAPAPQPPAQEAPAPAPAVAAPDTASGAS